MESCRLAGVARSPQGPIGGRDRHAAGRRPWVQNPKSIWFTSWGRGLFRFFARGFDTVGATGCGPAARFGAGADAGHVGARLAMPGSRGLLGGSSGRASPRACFQAVSSLSHQATRPGDTGTGVGNAPFLCRRQAVVRLIPAMSWTRPHGRSRSSGPPLSTTLPFSRNAMTACLPAR